MATLVNLRKLTTEERTELERLARSRTEEARLVVRAKIVLGLAAGERPYQVADRVGVGRMAAYEWLHRFNAEGLTALSPRHGGGHPVVYGPEARRRVLDEVNRTPTPEADGTATWSLGTLRKALRSTPGGLPAVSTYTLWRVLHGAGYSHQLTRTWCPTGTALRRRKAGAAVVTDPDAGSKKS